MTGAGGKILRTFQFEEDYDIISELEGLAAYPAISPPEADEFVKY